MVIWLLAIAVLRWLGIVDVSLLQWIDTRDIIPIHSICGSTSCRHASLILSKTSLLSCSIMSKFCEVWKVDVVLMYTSLRWSQKTLRSLSLLLSLGLALIKHYSTLIMPWRRLNSSNGCWCFAAWKLLLQLPVWTNLVSNEVLLLRNKTLLTFQTSP